MSSEQRVAIVTGTASGMGEALARDLISKGWRVGCLDVQEEKGRSIVAELGERASFFKCDVADYDSQAAAFQGVWAKWGRLDALLANAGIIDRSSLYILGHRGRDEIPPKPDTGCTDIDFKGVMYGTQLATHFMRKNAVPGGQIVATSSIVGVHALPSFPEYCGAKAAVINFALAAAPILKSKENITINVVLPGIVGTSVIPQMMLDTFGPEGVTPVSNIVSAYDKFLNDPTVTGQVLECSVNKQLVVPRPAYADGEVTRRTTTTWDPFFIMLHGEGSGLPDALDAGKTVS